MVLKKVFIISLIVLVFLGIFSIIYFWVFKKDVDSVKNNVENIIENEDLNSLNSTSKKVINLTSESVISATLNNADGLIYFYNKLDGNLWTITDRGTNMTKVVEKNLMNVKSVEWSNDSNSAIISLENGKIMIFNHKNNQELVLKNGVDLASWSNLNDKMIYKFYDPDKKERSLNISNLDGSNWKKMATLPFRFVSFQKIPSSIQVAFWSSADSNNVTELFKTSITSSDESTKIFSDKFGADFLFSPEGSKVLISFVNEKSGTKMSLGMIDSQGKNFQDFQIPTLVQKVVWSKDGKTIYYAQPTEIPNGSMMPNDYLTKKILTQDTFWKMDIMTGKKERLAELKDLTEPIDATNLFLSRSEDALFFINRQNNLLYKLDFNL